MWADIQCFFAGTFDVTLTVTSNSGCTNSETYADYIYTEPTPEAEFYAIAPLCEPYIVKIVNESVNSTDCYWGMGDGSPLIAGCNPSPYQYQDHGIYEIGIIAMSALGCTDTTYQTIVLTDCASKVQVSPNPAINEILLEVPEDLIDESFSVVDLSGNVLIDDRIATLQNTIDISEFECGMYLIKFKGLDERIRFVKY